MLDHMTFKQAIEQFPQQLLYEPEMVNKEQLRPYERFIVIGMGGSLHAHDLLKIWNPVLPSIGHRDYGLPLLEEHELKERLIILSSYSGNTEETLAALAEAEAKGAKIVVIAGGGKLQEIAESKNHPFMLIPKVEQPRYVVLYNLKALVVALEAAGLVNQAQASAAIHQAGDFLKQKVTAWTATMPTKDNPAKKLAEELAGKSIVIYAGPLLAPVAYKWKINFNENAKNVAWWNQYPEFNHN